MTVTWEQLVELEPRLADVLSECQAVDPAHNPRFCANDVWYGLGTNRVRCDHPSHEQKKGRCSVASQLWWKSDERGFLSVDLARRV